MIEQSRFALNRSVYPHLDVAGFFELASRLGIQKVELRNDIPGGVLNGRTPAELNALAKKYNIKVIAINSVENFNFGSHLPALLADMPGLIELAESIGCEALLLCPSHTPTDRRSREQIREETVAALKAMRPHFEASKVLGYVEPIGFNDCSMRSLLDAQSAIHAAGGKCYKITVDTFHHVTGPDTAQTIEKEYDVSCTGLVHVSGVVGDTPLEKYTDGHRVLPSPGDKIDNVGQLALLEKLGYRGNISFETFSKDLLALDLKTLEENIRASVKFLQSSVN
jgi:2-keto-myo-inositol isomerase